LLINSRIKHAPSKNTFPVIMSKKSEFVMNMLIKYMRNPYMAQAPFYGEWLHKKYGLKGCTKLVNE
jgi:hypothetical protein